MQRLQITDPQKETKATFKQRFLPLTYAHTKLEFKSVILLICTFRLLYFARLFVRKSQLYKRIFLYINTKERAYENRIGIKA